MAPKGQFKCSSCGNCVRNGWKRTLDNGTDICVKCLSVKFTPLNDSNVSYFIDGGVVRLSYGTHRTRWDKKEFYILLKMKVHKQDQRMNELLDGSRNRPIKKTMIRQFTIAVENGEVVL